jgi:eukaryotic-like serine/threonine-protein kinase
MAFSLKDYKDLTKIGHGGMSTVYTAVQISLNRKVAIKKMATSLADNEVLVRRFENEAKSAASLDNDCIIRIYDFGMEDGAFYISMEYIEGTDLDELMAESRFVREVGLMMALQALKGLNYAHKHGVIHRDFKPANIRVSKNGLAKVLDFGLAHAGDSVNLTTTDAIMGTPMFMSPEQVKGEKEKDVRMDVFSAGVLLYKIISGKFPFNGNNVPAVLYSIIHTEPEDIRKLVPELPAGIAAVVRASLERNKAKRLPTLQPLIAALENFFFKLGVRDISREIAGYMAATPAESQEIKKRFAVYPADEAPSADFDAVTPESVTPFYRRAGFKVFMGALILLAGFLVYWLALPGPENREELQTVAVPKPVPVSIPAVLPDTIKKEKPAVNTVKKPWKQKALAPVTGTGFLHVFSTPWAGLSIDGNLIGNTPTPNLIALPTGMHSILLKREGFKIYTETVRIKSWDTLRLRINLKP